MVAVMFLVFGFLTASKKMVGNGIYTLFWFDLWMVGEILMDILNQSF